VARSRRDQGKAAGIRIFDFHAEKRGSRVEFLEKYQGARVEVGERASVGRGSIRAGASGCLCTSLRARPNPFYRPFSGTRIQVDGLWPRSHRHTSRPQQSPLDLLGTRFAHAARDTGQVRFFFVFFLFFCFLFFCFLFFSKRTLRSLIIGPACEYWPLLSLLAYALAKRARGLHGTRRIFPTGLCEE
jgi:hypothetical protein